MLLKIRALTLIPRRLYVNALYVPGDKATETIAVLEPVLDFDRRLADKTKLVENLTRRKPSIDVSDLYAQYELYKTVQVNKKGIEARRVQLRLLLSDLSKEIQAPNKTESMQEYRLEVSARREKTELVQKYKLEETVLKEDWKNLREHSHSIESTFINTFLDIPNDIHADTPDTAKLIASSNEAGKTEGGPFHLEYENQIAYYDESAYFLKNEAAQLDLHFPLHCVDFFRERQFIQFSNPDFAKTLIIEGGALPLDDFYEVKHSSHEKCLNLLQLVGGGSMLSYLGFIAKLKVYRNHFPFRWIATGKQYTVKCGNNALGLFDVCQSTCVQAFLVGTQEQMEENFGSTMKEVQQLYESIGVHFRTVYVAANELEPAECLSVRFEMYSPHLQRYIEVGRLSHFSDYISKRILFNYDENKKSHFPHIVAGTVCNVTRVLAILLETNQGEIKESYKKKM